MESTDESGSKKLIPGVLIACTLLVIGVSLFVLLFGSSKKQNDGHAANIHVITVMCSAFQPINRPVSDVALCVQEENEKIRLHCGGIGAQFTKQEFDQLDSLGRIPKDCSCKNNMDQHSVVVTGKKKEKTHVIVTNEDNISKTNDVLKNVVLKEHYFYADTTDVAIYGQIFENGDTVIISIKPSNRVTSTNSVFTNSDVVDANTATDSSVVSENVIKVATNMDSINQLQGEVVVDTQMVVQSTNSDISVTGSNTIVTEKVVVISEQDVVADSNSVAVDTNSVSADIVVTDNEDTDVTNTTDDTNGDQDVQVVTDQNDGDQLDGKNHDLKLKNKRLKPKEKKERYIKDNYIVKHHYPYYPKTTDFKGRYRTTQKK